jgi:coenzyme F420-reducing hydrogenase alpha subunit
MTQRIVIDPVTRIEGHAKISLYLDDAGEVKPRLTLPDALERVSEVRSLRFK